MRVVVDSSADFYSPTLVQRYGITLVPQTIAFGPEEFRDHHSDMDTEKFFQYLSHDVPVPRLIAPSVEDYAKVFSHLAQYTDQIVSLHTSRHLSEAFVNAKEAAEGLLGRCEIAVLDSQTVSAGLGLLAEYAAQIAETTSSLDEAVRAIRGAIGRTYSVFYVDTLDYIQHAGLLSEAQSILGTMLGIKPFLTIESGELLTMEKVRTRSQAVDKLVEFATEFMNIEKIVLLQNSPFTTEAIRQLQDRLKIEIGKRTYPTILYGPTLASYLGPDATGVAILESEYDL